MTERMKTFGFDEATILQIDTGELELENNLLNFIWRWGEVHHFANVLKNLKEIKTAFQSEEVSMLLEKFSLGVFCRNLLHES